MTSGELCRPSKDDWDVQLHPAIMDEIANGKELNHLRQWREFRRMTQEQLAAKIETTGAVISLLESGDRQLSPKWLRKLAPALGTTPGYLLDHDPNDLPTEFLDVIHRIPKESLQQALAILSTFARTGTDN